MQRAARAPLNIIFWEGSPFLKLDKLGLHFEILHRPVVASVLMNFQTQMRLYDKHVMFCGGSVAQTGRFITDQS